MESLLSGCMAMRPRDSEDYISRQLGNYPFQRMDFDSDHSSLKLSGFANTARCNPAYHMFCTLKHEVQKQSWIHAGRSHVVTRPSAATASTQARFNVASQSQYMCVCMYIYMCVCIHIYMHMYLDVCSTSIYIGIFLFISACICI